MFRPAPVALLLGLICTTSTVSAQGYHAPHHHSYDSGPRHFKGSDHLHGDYSTGHGHRYQEDFHHDHEDDYSLPQRLNRVYCPMERSGYDEIDYPAYDPYQAGPGWSAPGGPAFDRQTSPYGRDEYNPEQTGRYGRQNPGRPGYQPVLSDYSQGPVLPYEQQQLPGRGADPGYGPQSELDQYPQYQFPQPEQSGRGLNDPAPYSQGPQDSRQFNPPQRYPSGDQYQGELQNQSTPGYGRRIPDSAIRNELPTPPEFLP